MPDGPLGGTTVAVPPSGAASDCARILLHCLGAEVTSGDDLALAGSDATADWAASGAMALTGTADGPPRLIEGTPASLLRAALALLPAQSQHPEGGVQVLGERAAAAGLHRRAPWSAGGSFRALRAQDGWLGLSLARTTDVDLLPALIGACVTDPWADVGAWAKTQPVSVAEQRAIVLGLPATLIPPEPPIGRAPIFASRGGRRRTVRQSIVLDLTSLWAGPLCAHLLGLAGARVIKVESVARLDGARRGPSTFFDLLHAGHESVVLDFATPAGRDALHALVAAADLVLEASRPRALAQLGLHAADAVANGTSWVSITAYGRDEPKAMRVGFGDDVAAAAGLVWWADGIPIPVGDAIADPLAGAVAAAAASAALASPDAWLIDVSMRDVAALARTTKPDIGEAEVVAIGAGWAVHLGDRQVPIADPVMRSAASVAAAPGAHTVAVLAEFLR